MCNLAKITTIAALTISTNSFAISTTDLAHGVAPNDLVAELIDTTASNITYSNISYKGANGAAGSFTGGVADGLGIDKGIILSTGRIANAIGPNKCYKTTTVNGQPGDPQLGISFDAAALEFDFIPTSDKLEFQYVFASEEYNEFVNSNYNDVFAFFLDGQNIALIPGTATEVAINSVNLKTNSQYYHDNAYPISATSWNDYFRNPCQAGQPTPFQTEFDGFTTVLKASANVVPGHTHHMKLVIADRGDYSLDSAVFIQGKSFQSLPAAPAKVSLVSPQGTGSDRKLSYTWNAVANVTQYKLKVEGANGQAIAQSYTIAEAGCAADTGICAVAPPTELPDGNYQWWVQASNTGGDSPWSDAMSFKVEVIPPPPPPPAAPAKVSLVSPQGTDRERKLSYTWNAVANVTQYKLKVEGANGQAIAQSYTIADAGCAADTGICAVTPPTELPDGDYQWWVQASNTGGDSPWSDAMSFKVEVIPPPAKVSLVSPQGTGRNRKLSYTWNAVANATQYKLKVEATKVEATTPTATPYEGATVEATTPVTGATATPYEGATVEATTPVTGTTGTATPYEGATEVTKPAEDATATATPYENAKPVAGANATATQNKATQYKRGKRANGQTLAQSYTIAEANCATGTGICSVTPPTELPDGDYQWWIQATNNSGDGLWSDVMFFRVEVIPPPPPVTTCQLYAVTDQERSDSQFLVIDPQTRAVTPLGEIYPDADIEALTAHPVTKELYAASSGDAISDAGALYKVNPTNGTYTLIGHLTLADGSTIDDIEGLSFHPDTNQLWGWAQGKGLFKVDVNNLPKATAELKWSSKDTIEDLTWNAEGTALYLGKLNQLVRYDGIKATPVCTFPKGKRIESLVMTPDGLLLLGIHNELPLHLLDPKDLKAGNASCQTKPFEVSASKLDIEGMAWVCTTKVVAPK